MSAFIVRTARRVQVGAAPIPARFGIRSPWTCAARRLSRAWSALAKAFAPIREVHTVAIIGSYATGTPRASSDLDVLVLVDGAEKTRYQASSICMEIGISLDWEVNALIYSTQEFAQRLRERDPQARHMACGALVVKGTLPRGAPRRRPRRAPATRTGVIPLGRAVSDRLIAGFLEISDVLLRDSSHLDLSDIGRIGAAIEATRYMVSAILEIEGLRLKGEDYDGIALQRAYIALDELPPELLTEAYRIHVQRDLWQISPETRDHLLMETRTFCRGARAWLIARRPSLER